MNFRGACAISFGARWRGCSIGARGFFSYFRNVRTRTVRKCESRFQCRAAAAK